MSYCPCPNCEGRHDDAAARALAEHEADMHVMRVMMAEVTRLPLSYWQRTCHDLARAKGWHDDAETQPEIDYVAAACANLHGEVSELWEAARRGELREPCDKPVALTCLEEELADIAIRVLDTAGRIGVDLERAVARKHAFNATREQRHGGKVR